MVDDHHQTPNDVDKELFEKIHQLIVDRKLFLDPTFSREQYIRLGFINKNKVARMLKENAGMNLTKYINDLRLEYALGLMKTAPDEPLKAIAVDSGFASIRTFYRLFLRKFGVTPTTYRKNL